MAIFSLNHSFIGRTTHAAGSASHFARYITRPDVCRKVIGERMPTARRDLMHWLDQQEQGDRKNARVIDKVVVALPIELSREDNLALLQKYGERMSQGRASWVAALHDGPGDADNPHAHLVFRDRDITSGKRVMMTTESGSTQVFREAWELEVNLALERAGLEQRVSCRSLEEQGIDREAQIHVGAGAKAMERKGVAVESTERRTTEIIHGRITDVTINYPAIDQGRTRLEENEARLARNLERAAHDDELDWTRRGGMIAQQRSAMEWVQAAELRAELLYQKAMRGADTTDADAMDLAEVVAHMQRHNDRGTDELRQAEIALAWEARASELGKTYLQERAIQRDQHLEQDFEP